MKICTKCGQNVLLSEHYKHSSGYVHPWCKNCFKASVNAYRLKNLKRCRKIARIAAAKWRKANRKEAARLIRVWNKKNSDRKFYYVYGITVADFKVLLEAQDYKCAICKTAITVRRKQHLDHDHSCCGKVGIKWCGKCIRGVLCQPCNQAVGFFKDSEEVCLSAAQYLRRYTCSIATRK